MRTKSPPRHADPLGRVGLELELLAPDGLTRTDVAHALAKRVKGRVEYGFKYYTQGERTEDGKVLCRLCDAVRVLDAKGRVLVTIVPDNTLHDGLALTPRAWMMATDDLRLALLVERECWSSSPDPVERLKPVQRIFQGEVVDGDVRDRYGHQLVFQLSEPLSYRRVCEFVTRPLQRRERGPTIATILACANECGLTIPTTAALHAHYDAAPWQDIATLSRFLRDSGTHFERWRRELQPNPNCTRLGPQPDGVLEVARRFKSKVDFHVFGAALALTGAHKACDFNILGVIRRASKQPTLEVRCLPMSLERREIETSLNAAERILAPYVRVP